MSQEVPAFSSFLSNSDRNIYAPLDDMFDFSIFRNVCIRSTAIHYDTSLKSLVTGESSLGRIRQFLHKEN